MSTTDQETTAAEAGALTDDELAMLDLEASWWKYAAVKDTVVRERFDISPTVYYSRLNALIDRPEALAAAPLVVRRLQRLRDARADSARPPAWLRRLNRAFTHHSRP
jgi:hypothetical protein